MVRRSPSFRLSPADVRPPKLARPVRPRHRAASHRAVPGAGRCLRARDGRAQAPAQAQRPPPRAEKPAPRPPAKARAPAARKPKPESEGEVDAAAAPRLPASTQAQLRALLSAPNRRALNVDRMPTAQAEALRRSLLEAFTLGQASANDGGFESSIAGRFDGWNGDTVVRLLDGTRWRQVDGAVVVHHAFMPPVTVYRSGTIHRMRIEGVGRSVSVEPLAAAGRGAASPADGAR